MKVENCSSVSRLPACILSNRLVSYFPKKEAQRYCSERKKKVFYRGISKDKLRFRMRLLIYVLQLVYRIMGINLRSRQAGMAKQFFYRVYIGPVVH